MLLKALFVLAWLAALCVLVFLIFAVMDGSLWYAPGFWIAQLIGMSVVLWGGHVLAAKGNRVAAGLLLAIPAVPLALYGLFLLTIMIFPVRWN